jgi:hypothetical protein
MILGLTDGQKSDYVSQTYLPSVYIIKESALKYIQAFCKARSTFKHLELHNYASNIAEN